MQADLTVGELLEMYARYYPHPLTPDDVIELVELDAKRDERVRRGCRAASAAGSTWRSALVGDPDLLFLDEPTTGFDPHARRQAWAAIRSLCSLGKTVFLTTHYMDEAQALADRVAVMAGGQLVAIGPPSQLAGRDALPTEIRFALPAGIEPAQLPDLDGERDGRRPHGPRHDRRQRRGAARLTGWALERDVALAGLAVVPALARGRLPHPHHRPGDLSMSAVALPAPAARSSLRRDLELAAWQVRYEQRAFWRNRRAAIFSFGFPIMLLLVFGLLNKGNTVDTRGVSWDDVLRPRHPRLRRRHDRVLQHRDQLRLRARLRRDQAHPGHAAAVVGLHGRAHRLDRARDLCDERPDAGDRLGPARRRRSHASMVPGLLCGLVLGTMAFTALGIGFVRFLPSADTAGPMQAFLIMPIAFISNVFFPLDDAPAWLENVADALPAQAAGRRAASRVRRTRRARASPATTCGRLAVWTRHRHDPHDAVHAHGDEEASVPSARPPEIGDR